MCIFERFYRGEKPCSREGGWAGIGLAIVKEMGFVPIQKGGPYGFGRPHSGACPVPGEPRGTALRLAPECVDGAAALGTSQAPWARWGRGRVTLGGTRGALPRYRRRADRHELLVKASGLWGGMKAVLKQCYRCQHPLGGQRCVLR